MVKFGIFVFPNVKGWRRVKPRIYSETPLPSQSVASRQDLGSTGYIVEIWGVIAGTNEEVRNKINEMESLSDGVERIFDFEKEDPTFSSIMLEPEFERIEGFANFVPYRVRIVQSLKGVTYLGMIGVYEVLDKSGLCLEIGKTTNPLITTYMKNACILGSNTIVADPTGMMASYDGGYVCKALIFKAGTGEEALAKACLDEFELLQKIDGSWSQQYRPERLEDGTHDEYENRQVDSGASLLAEAMAKYDESIGPASVIYLTTVRRAFNFLREAQYQHQLAHGTNLLANQRFNDVWNTGALLADCAEALLASLTVLNQYGTDLTSLAGYSIKTFANDLCYAIGTSGWMGNGDGYYRTEYPIGTEIWELATIIQGISFTQALCAKAIWEWQNSVHNTVQDFKPQCEKALDYTTALGVGKWGGAYYSPLGAMPLHAPRYATDISDEYPVFTALMILAWESVNPTKYAKQIERGRKFIQLCALPQGEVFNLCRINSVLGETPDVEGHYHFRVYNSSIGLLAGA